MFTNAPTWVKYHYQTSIGTCYWLENKPTSPVMWSGKSELVKHSGFGLFEEVLTTRVVAIN